MVYEKASKLRGEGSRRRSCCTNFMVEAVSARGLPKLSLEGATEGRFRLVSHFGPDFRYTPRRILK